jgi:hypothetical protein
MPSHDICWILLLQEFDLEIGDKKGADNCVADHISRMQVKGLDLPINEYLRDDTLLKVTTSGPWYAIFVNIIVIGYIPPGEDRKKLIHLSRFHLWDDPYLFKVLLIVYSAATSCYVRTASFLSVVTPHGGHYGAVRTHAKVWQNGLF